MVIKGMHFVGKANGVGSFDNGFGIDLFVNRDLTEAVEEKNLFIGQPVYARVGWSVTTVQSKIGFYVEDCDVIFPTGTQIRIISNTCYATTFSTVQLQKEKIVATESTFRFNTFMAGGGAQSVKLQLQCGVILCTADDTSQSSKITYFFDQNF